MVKQVVTVNCAGSEVGALSFDTDSSIGAFEYSTAFIGAGIELSPLKMPLGRQIYSFPELNNTCFRGLPGLVADSLPDDFGNAVLNAWIASQGKSPQDITPLERLQYTGTRGMGALEYAPARRQRNLNASTEIEIAALVAIAQDILDDRTAFSVALQQGGREDREAMLSLLSVGMSAGGARPKAVLAFNEDFTQVRSGQARIPGGFTHFLMKFDGVHEHRSDRQTFGDPQGYGAMEFVYSQIAGRCGIDMMPCRLLDEGNRRHFVTQRFDRDGNRKIHMQTLSGLAHVDYQKPGSFSYAELFSVARQLRLSARDAEQLLKRMVFNLVARNHDDHSKNFAFLLIDEHWQLSPAYDLAYSFKPDSWWVQSHWMSLNGKRDDFTRDDIYSLEKLVPRFTRKFIDQVVDQTVEQVAEWPALARAQQVPEGLVLEIESNLRLQL
ncbi:MAG: type II toxin-antitoxin system HipA family toxin [Halioglobus sp.]